MWAARTVILQENECHAVSYYSRLRKSLPPDNKSLPACYTVRKRMKYCVKKTISVQNVENFSRPPVGMPWLEHTTLSSEIDTF